MDRATPPRRKRRVILCLAAPFLLAAAVLLEENARGRLLLWQVDREMRAAGEQLTLADLGLPRPAVPDNAAPAAIAAARELQALADSNRLVSFGPRGLMKPAEPGRATCASRAARFPSENGYRSLDREAAIAADDWLLASAQLANAKAPLDRLRAALAQPALAIEADYAHGVFALPGEEDLTRSHRWLMSDAVCALHAGKLDAAVDDVRALRSLARLQRTDLRLFSQTAAFLCDGYTCALVWEALQTRGWTEEGLARLQTAMQDDGELPAALRAFEVQRALLPGIFGDARASHTGRMNAFRLEGRDIASDFIDADSTPLPMEFRVHLHSILWMAAWSHQDEARAMDLWSRFLERARPIASDHSWIAFADRYPKRHAEVNGVANWAWSFSELVNPESARYLLAKITRGGTERQMAVAAIALKRWELRHGAPAKTLGELSPDLLPDPPLDLMDGRPLRYHLRKDNSFALYSVGLDGKDDGGDPTTTTGEDKVRSLWAGRDAVWPVAKE